jgi:hypothetical protein
MHNPLGTSAGKAEEQGFKSPRALHTFEGRFHRMKNGQKTIDFSAKLVFKRPSLVFCCSVFEPVWVQEQWSGELGYAQ